MQKIIDALDLKRHPEGGYYRETFRSKILFDGNGPESFPGSRNLATSIYFCLPSNDVSLFHKIKSDELWYYHAGSPLTLFVLNDHGLSTFKLGSNLHNGEHFQVLIKANSWFGAIVNEPDSFTLSGCMVAPGFDFADFEMAERKQLLETYPAHEQIILRLTKP